jgi:predicted RNA-binding protein associated with RNAse of E/G family
MALIFSKRSATVSRICVISVPLDFMQAIIHYTRPGKGLTVYTEGFVFDDGQRVRTYTELSEEAQAGLTEALQKQHLMSGGRRVGAIRKHYFYAEPFNVLEFFDTDGQLIAYYSDITTLLTKADGVYALTDLWLDMWLTPDGVFSELDWDEFEEAIAAGLATPAWQTLARATMARLKAEAASGVYPQKYVAKSMKEEV